MEVCQWLLIIIKMLRVFQQSKKSLVYARLLTIQTRSFRLQTQSKVTNDVQTVFETKQPELEIELEGFARGKFAQKFPDYEVSFEDIVIKSKSLVKNDPHAEHPIETDVRECRLKADLYARLQDNQILMTNLGYNQDHSLTTLTSVSSFLKDKVHRDLDIQKIQFIKAVQPPGEPEKLAYILVTLGSKRQAYMAKSALRKEWIGNNLLKIKVTEDVKSEHFNNRTILVREIPRYLRVDHVLSIFGTKFGAVTNVEFPTEYAKIKSLINEQSQRVGSKQDDEKVEQIRSAEIQIKQSLAVDYEYHDFLKEKLGEDTAIQVIAEMQSDPNLSAPEALDQERLTSLISLVTHLQAEGQHVLQKKLDVLDLKSQQNLLENQSGEQSEETLKKYVKHNSQKIKEVLEYLERSKSEAQVVANADDFLSNLLHLTKGELMYAYDELIKELEKRENLVSERLKESIEHFSENERILMERKDWNRETEDVGNPFDLKLASIEQIISVNQQVDDIYMLKKMSTEEKLHRILKKELNPFLEGNFTPQAIAAADRDLAKQYKFSNLPNLLKNKTFMRTSQIKSDFKPEMKTMFEDMLKNLKENFDTPFDEIYHKEKSVVSDVINAQKALKEKQAQMTDPMAHRLLDEKLLTVEQRETIQHLLDENKPRFDRSVEREQERILQTQIEKLDKVVGMAGKYSFTQNDEQRWRAMVEADELSQSDLQKLIQIRKENNTQNLGYCFITFSHADEARMMLMMNKNPQFMEDKKIEFDLKSNIDHGDLDMQYFVKRSKNDILLIDEYETLRVAKQNLREFEKNMDKSLPKNTKLQKFKERVKDLIEDHKYDTRQMKTAGDRDEMDQARLDRKIKQLEQRFPNINFAQLYASEQSENAKLALHKKAYASYKAYQFLKNGVKTTKDLKDEEPKLSKAQQRLIDNDPYNFPMLNQTVYRILSKDVVVPTAIDKGDTIDKPGRRNTITSQEYIESYFGKDLMRQPRQKIQNDGIFTFQETLKKKYPMEQFLRMPEMDKKLKKIEDLGLDMDYKKFPHLKPKNDKISALLDKNAEHFYDQLAGDKMFNIQHETDPSRNLVGDMMNKFEATVAAKRGVQTEGYFVPGMIDKIKKDLEQEYNHLPNQKFVSRKLEKQFDLFNKNRLRKVKTATKISDEKTTAKFETEYDEHPIAKERGYGQQELDEEQQKISNEFFYKAKLQPKTVENSLSERINEQTRKEFYKKPLEERLGEDPPSVEAYSQILKGEAHIVQAGNQYGGKFFKSHKLGMDRVEDRFSQHKQGKSLKEFFSKDDQTEQPRSDFDQEDEMDAYEHYRRQVDDIPKKDENERLKRFNIDQESMQPDMPRFDSYFDSKAKGVHPFESIANSFDPEEIRNVDEDEFEKLEEEELYKRELLGRLMGQKLTPRQFDVLTGQYSAHDLKLDRYKEASKADFIQKRDKIRLMEEYLEKTRRYYVNSGEWQEEESSQKLKELISKTIEEGLTPSERSKLNREIIKMYHALRLIDNPESLFEKEYHFDEGLGVSLTDHMNTLRKQYPGSQVMSRRDRDGFAIIKVSFKPEYKFDMEALTNFNIEDEKAKFLQSTEEILKRASNGKNLEDCVNELQIQHEIQKIASNSRLVQDLSSFAKLAINQLVKERVHGIYKNNNDGFVEEIFKVLEEDQNQQSSKSKVKDVSLLDLAERRESGKSIVDEIYADRDRFRADMQDQIRRRTIKHQNLTKRTESDFIKPKVNEKAAYANQVALNDSHIDNLENKEREAQTKQGEEFDKEAYYRLKEELRTRKETKERLLSQGLPQFKAYMRF